MLGALRQADGGQMKQEIDAPAGLCQKGAIADIALKELQAAG